MDDPRAFGLLCDVKIVTLSAGDDDVAVAITSEIGVDRETHGALAQSNTGKYST